MIRQMFAGAPIGAVAVAISAMAAVVAASNVLVQYPVTLFSLHDYLTWGAFTYPVAFLVTDLTNRRFGPATARRVVAAGFIVAVIMSSVLATPRIAFASGTAFLAAHLIDIGVFDWLRRGSWWRAPLVSSLIGSVADTTLFFSLAFAASGVGSAVYPLPFGPVEAPVWMGWAVVDFLVKTSCALTLLVPFRVLMGRRGTPLQPI